MKKRVVWSVAHPHLVLSFRMKHPRNPYLGYVYTSFQERATKVSHGNTGKLAKQYGDATMGKICNPEQNV